MLSYLRLIQSCARNARLLSFMHWPALPTALKSSTHGIKRPWEMGLLPLDTEAGRSVLGLGLVEVGAEHARAQHTMWGTFCWMIQPGSGL